MKKIVNLFFAILIASLTISCGVSGKTAVDIDGENLTIDQFNKYYYTQNKIMLNLDKEAIDKLPQAAELQYPTLNRSKFMDSIIQSKLIIHKAMKDKDIDQDELQAIIDISKLQAVSQYYLMIKLKKDIKISDEEVAATYKKYKARYKRVPIDQAEQDIKRKLFMQKFQIETGKFIQNLMAESQIKKDGFEKYLKEQANSKKQPKAATTTETKKQTK